MRGRQAQEAGPLVAGVDGCKAGWIVVRARLAPSLAIESVEVLPSFKDVLAATQVCVAVAVDMPIGLSDNGRREADILARKCIGRRASSVFPAPVRPVLRATSYREACFISAESHRESRKISRQTFALVTKIREVDACITPAMQTRVVESHPEVAFWALNDRHPLVWPKRSPEGADDRRRLLTQVFGDDVSGVTRPSGAAWDDLYDACVLAWTAGRLAQGEAVRIPAQPPVDGRGLRMEIVY